MEAFVYRDSVGTVHRFWLDYREERGPNGVRSWIFDIWRVSQLVCGESPYHARFDEVDGDTVQSAMLDNNGNQWAMRIGLSEAIFDEAHRRLGRRIVASRKWVEGAGEWRTPQADRMWKRFEKAGLAKYARQAGRYVYISPRATPSAENLK